MIGISFTKSLIGFATISNEDDRMLLISLSSSAGLAIVSEEIYSIKHIYLLITIKLNKNKKL